MARDFDVVRTMLREAVEAHAFPAACIEVGRHDGSRWTASAGAFTFDPYAPLATPDTIFDLASLTKVIAATTLTMRAADAGRLALDDLVAQWFPDWRGSDRGKVTVRQLLTHSSGLTAYLPLYRDCTGRFEFEKAICTLPLEYAPGTQSIYSDLGFMLLGSLIEEISGTSLDRFCHEKIFRPLGLRATAFVDLSLVRARRLTPITDMIAPTERCPWRKRVLCGEVHDDNAYAMGGVAGHAGLFTSARDVHAMLLRLEACWAGTDDFIPQAVMREFWTRGDLPGSTWALGWDTPSPSNSASGTLFSPLTVGHLGFTGTSIWIDLERDRHVILLSNRVHPSRDNEAIREFRPVIHDLVNQSLAA